ncbi:unnamed protein product [Heligmosomoides polygyrus]|uniref:Transposase n=1 Tax=Heligmosomoides polygyrus TaxID=6339 RepID=A0A183G750_HELPZ|nr:unnamed protein product [Heligmosomoides polygyrus]
MEPSVHLACAELETRIGARESRRSYGIRDHRGPDTINRKEETNLLQRREALGTTAVETIAQWCRLRTLRRRRRINSARQSSAHDI